MKFLLLLTLEEACEDCLRGDGWQTHFWCVDTNTCMPLSESAKCQNQERHDLVLNATRCCSNIQTEDECLSSDSLSPNMNWCLWCPEHEGVAGQCMYNDDPVNINQNCKTNPDITSHCSEYPDCAACAEDVVCAWCPSMGRCVTAILENMDYPLDEYKCLDGMTKICCESYMDCETCSQYSGQIDAQICTWCATSANGDGACMTHDQALANLECRAINEFGKQYCDDECYMNGRDCDSCISTTGCIWLDDVTYTNDGSKPLVTSFCTQGGSSGPKEHAISYETTLTMPYEFQVNKYYYMTCSINAKTLNTLIISIICSVVAVIVVTYISVTIYKRVKYNRLMKENAKREVTEEEKKLLQQKQEEFDIEDFMITIQAVPWTD